MSCEAIEMREYAVRALCYGLKVSTTELNLDFAAVTKIIKSKEQQSFALCLALLDASTGKFDNVNELCPTDDSLVI